jgi:hypothetical protein
VRVSFEDAGMFDPALFADLIHEVCHFWCFDSFVGQAIALIEFRQRLLARILPSGGKLDRNDLFRASVANALMTPLAEGMALLTEFDIWRSEHQGTIRTPIALVDLLIAGSRNIKEDYRAFLVSWSLERHRDTVGFIRRKMNLYLSDFEVAEGYVSGYMTLKNLLMPLAMAFAGVKQETVLQFLKEYFWNDPVLARLILVGADPPERLPSPETGPLSAENLFMLNAAAAGLNELQARREFFRQERRNKPFEAEKPFESAPVIHHLKARIRRLFEDPALGGKLGAIQARMEHGVEAPTTWEIDVDKADIDRFRAAELELQSYAANYFYNHSRAEQFGLKVLSAPLIFGLQDFRRLSPLMTLGLIVLEDHIHCISLAQGVSFDVPRATFGTLGIGNFTYYLISNASTLRYAEIVMPLKPGEPEIVLSGSIEDLVSASGQTSIPLRSYLELLHRHTQFQIMSQDFVAKAAGTLSEEDLTGIEASALACRPEGARRRIPRSQNIFEKCRRDLRRRSPWHPIPAYRQHHRLGYLARRAGWRRSRNPPSCHTQRRITASPPIRPCMGLWKSRGNHRSDLL